MMLRALSADFLKIRGKGIWFLIFLAPIGIIAMQALNFGLRYDYLTKQYRDDLWGGVIKNVGNFVPIALYLGATLVGSLIAGVEHQLSSWKQLLALPISRTAVFVSKYIMTILLLFVSCILLSFGTAGLGLALGCDPNQIPYADLAIIGFYPFIASLPVLALQLWLSLSFKNQVLPVTLGLSMALGSVFTAGISEAFPLNWPKAVLEGINQGVFMGLGLGFGLILTLIGLIHFTRKDVD
ncbi:permease [Paenibacillus sp. CAA11]|uniref:ABC transporter permease n=1 Tax=Paenibacillus sp. CAA11 TaxID=1532905 RepID=UPI000D359BC7|nr:ABC transporter permease [Paenibacillus sp. CAA11]AWB42917.1 permease [Paenibacillus sp. CAA11]